MNKAILRPDPNDIKAVFELQTRSDIAEYGEPDSELSDLEHAWRGIDLTQDAWVVKGDPGKILGYSAVVPYHEDFRFDLYVDPQQSEARYASELLACCEARAASLAVKEALKARTFLAHINQEHTLLFTAAGFDYVKSFYQFHIDLNPDLESPSWPAGVLMRTAIPEADDEAIYRAVQTAFERPEDQRPTFEQWRAHMIRPELYDSGLWFLAVAGDEIVGTSLGIKYETDGWIRQLGVIPGWRGMGIALALLRHSFLAFRERGYDRVGLGMEARNEKALRLYKRAGMRLKRQYDEYTKMYNPA